MMVCMAKFRSMMKMSAAVCSMSMLAIGCGGGGGNSKVTVKPRASATGKVTLDGKPVPSGTINFSNTETGNAASGTITDGVYTISAANGPNPGANGVLIIGKEKAGEDDKWQASGKADVPAAGLTQDFEFKAKETKPVRKKVVDN